MAQNRPELPDADQPGCSITRPLEASHALYQNIPVLNSLNNVRVLKILAKPSEQRMSFELCVYSLDKMPPYTALSYMWGAPGSRNEVHINGQPFRVQDNVWAYLRQTVNQDFPRMTNYVWIDAICIDQNNDQERSHQVTRMREIYSRVGAPLYIWCELPNTFS